MPALALTDHGNLFGAIEFYQEAEKAGVKPILGWRPTSPAARRQDRDARRRRSTTTWSCWPRTTTGYQQPDEARLAGLPRGLLLQAAHRPRAARAARRGADRALGLPQGRGRQTLLEERRSRAPSRPRCCYRDIFGADNFFLEIQDHGIARAERPQPRAWSSAAAADRHPAGRHQRRPLPEARATPRPHDVLLCIQTGKTMDDPKRMRYDSDQFYFKSRRGDGGRCSRELAAGAAATRVAIAERCNLRARLRQARSCPTFPLPAGVASAERLPRRAGRAPGCAQRYRPTADAEAGRAAPRLRAGRHRRAWASLSYFLIVLGLHPLRAAAGHPGRARAAARCAGSLVAYALGITDIDPLALQPALRALPQPRARRRCRTSTSTSDETRRGEVIEYVKQKYGEEQRRPDHHLRHAGRQGASSATSAACSGMPFAEVRPHRQAGARTGSDMTLEKALEQEPDLKALPQTRRRVRQAACSSAPRARGPGAPRLGSTPPACVIAPGPLHRLRAAVPREQGRRSPPSAT